MMQNVKMRPHFHTAKHKPFLGGQTKPIVKQLNANNVHGPKLSIDKT